MADTELNISPDEKIAGVPLARLLRNLDETSYNEGACDLACRLTDCKAVIEELLQQRALASRPAEVDDERQWIVVGGRRAGRTFLAALARDANRYRWMRNAQWFKAGIAKTELNASSFHYSGDMLDQLVDAGRAAGVHGEGAGK